MKRIQLFFTIGLLTAVLLIVGCSEDETESITLSTTGTTELYSVTNQSADIKFTASSSWKASSAAKWLTVSPKSGDAGSQVITVATTATNRTGSSRVSNVTIESGGTKKTISVKQRGEYAVFDVDELNVPSEGGTYRVDFRTNLEENQLFLYASAKLEDWLKDKESDARTRADYTGYLYPLRFLPNESTNARDGALFWVMKDKAGNPILLDTLFVYQEARDLGYMSSDYSADGKVELLNKATEGKGIPIVLMGDGFVDKEIADSTYARVMQQTMDNLFSEEPIKSLRDYFNVYQVTAVSPRNLFEGISSTAFGTVPDRQTMGIDVDANAVMKYVKKVEGIDSLNTLAVVILNSSISRGVTYMMGSNKQEYNYAIALCPVIDSLKSESFRQVLTHEAVGHGFAKLADEYVRSTEGSATDKDIKELKDKHEKLGWFLNVDSEKDSTKVLWTKFIYDPEFANEQIGTYEGGYTFYKGVYRPTQESMMRSNNAPFNAPSRQAIYNKVMKLGLGKTATYEEFVAFDQQHKPPVWTYQSRTRQGGEIPWRPAPPRIIFKTW
ncbi:MAG: hypothetical protein J5658_10310 [Prevotella sp.]|nr:hypothetical protein [Prevotella sp.]